MNRALLVILIALFVRMPGLYAQSTPAGSDSTVVSEALEEYEERIRYGFLVDPFSLYSSTYGFGIRAMATLYNVPFTGSRLRATLRPSQRRGVYGLSLRTHDPDLKDVFALLSTRFETNNAYRFYGLGFESQESDRLFVDMNRFQVLTRVGIQFADDRYMIQPFGQYVWNRTYGIGEDDDPTDLDERSQSNLAYALGNEPGQSGESDSVQKGFRLGLSLQADYRDRTAYPTSGALFEVTGSHYFSGNDLDVSFNSLRTEGHAFVGLGGDQVLAFRALVEMTDSKGDDPIPFYLLPEVDFSTLGGYKAHRFVDNDRLVVTAEYRRPLVNLADLYQVSGFVQAGLGSVFEDLGDMKLAVSFDRDPDPADRALRPGFGVGVRVAALEQGRDLIYWMLGFGPEGVTLAAFRFVHPLTDIL